MKNKREIIKKHLNLQKKKLKKRFNVEHLSKQIKQFNRISIRIDRSDFSYISNVFLALLIVYKI